MKKLIKYSLIAIVGLFLFIVIVGSLAGPIEKKESTQNSAAGETVDYSKETSLVTTKIANEKLGLEASQFKVTKNPSGEGVIVFYPQTNFFGVERHLFWLVIDGQAYPLNGASKDVTTELPWLRDAKKSVQDRSGLNPAMVGDEVIEEIFQERS